MKGDHNKSPIFITMQSYQESLIFSLLLLPFLFIIVSKWLPQNITTKKNLPPSPPKLPIIGNLHQLGVYPYRSLRTLSQKYGDIILLHLGRKPTIIVSSSELASQILKTHDAVFASRPELPIFKRLLGKGNDVVSSPYGEQWRRLKAICIQDLLSKKRVESFRNVREEEVDLLVKEIERLRFVNLSEMFKSFGVGLASRMCFGRKYRGDDEIGIDFNKLVSEFVELVGDYYVGDFVSWLGWIDRIKGVDAKVNRVATTFDTFIMKILEKRWEENNENGEAPVKDFVDLILDAQRRDSCGNHILEKEDIKGVILDIFAAGSEAIYITLEWMMSELLKNCSVMEKLRKEVTEIVGNKHIVTQDDLKNMNYLKSVFKETLRLHPPSPLLAPHQSTHDMEIKGFYIARGTQVLVNGWSIFRDPRYWEKPESFCPERFLNSSIDFKGNDFDYIPFGSGRRMCPGKGLVTSIVELVIANLVHRFKWSLPDGKENKYLDMEEASGLIVHKKTPLFAVAAPRTKTCI